MKTFTNVLQAYCCACGSEATAQRFLTFAFWHCPHCKDEVEVKLHLTLTPRGELYAYSPKEDALTISDAGIYLLTYVNGTYEWYEHHAGTRDLKLHRTLVQSATRTLDRDLPSRKQVQPVSNSGEREESTSGRLCVRTIPNAAYSSSGTITTADLAKASAAAQQKAYTDAFNRAFPLSSGISGSASGGLPSNSKASMWDMASGNKRVQRGQVPPNDDL